MLFSNIKFFILILLNVAFANPPNWEDNPGAYEITATIAGAVVMNDDAQMGDEGDMLAAFDDAGNVRGVGIMLMAPFGPYAGTSVWEVGVRSNTEGDVLTFQYYDASEDAVLDIVEGYTFVAQDILGDVINPIIYNIGFLAITDDLRPMHYTMEQNYPNPYNPKTSINYTVSQLSNVTMKIYDIRGQLIVELVNMDHRPGKYEKIWDSGHLATGMYFLKMEANSINGQLLFSDINKMLYLK